MASSLYEQLMDLVATKLATITVANGYEQTVVGVHRPPIALFDLETADLPALLVRQEDNAPRFHLRGAEEFVLEVEVICAVDGEAADKAEALSDLVADVKKLAHLNRYWNNGAANLARRTRITDGAHHETEVTEYVESAVVRFQIMARSDLKNPYIKKDV
jgi:hypothetical protein